jgi:hypothetical protein
LFFRPAFNTLAFALLTCPMALSLQCHGAGASELESTTPIRIGWQIPAATQGQVLQVLKRTNVLESHGLKPIFVPFSYGGPQV